MTTLPPTIVQARFDLRLVIRNGEQFLLTLAIPVLLLIGLTLTTVVSLGQGPDVPRVSAALAGILAVAVLSSAFASLAISVGFDRRSGSLEFLATTPLSRTDVLVARSLAAVAVVGYQVAALLIVARILGWHPEGIPGVIAFAALGGFSLGAWGFALGGWVRAEATLAIANGLFILLVLAGGTALPVSSLPGPLAAIVSWLPTAALGDAFRAVLGVASGSLARDALVLAAWALAGAVVAARTFRWY